MMTLRHQICMWTQLLWFNHLNECCIKEIEAQWQCYDRD
jgi:hypothetical protein